MIFLDSIILNCAFRSLSKNSFIELFLFIKQFKLHTLLIFPVFTELCIHKAIQPQ